MLKRWEGRTVIDLLFRDKKKRLKSLKSGKEGFSALKIRYDPGMTVGC